tara:strand:- start:2633 stop:2962 length:330 start_codon:yes stop_codon:yes gene_type:complete
VPRLAVETGRLRRVEAAIYGASIITGGTVWFGWTGAIFMAVIVARLWPPATLVLQWGDRRLRYLRLSQRSVSFGTWWRTQTLYRDELPRGDFARIRRELKRAVNEKDMR